MSHKKNYTKIFSFLFITLFAFTLSQKTQAATFPIIQDFSGTKPADWEIRASSTWNTTVSGDQTVRLTSAVQGNSGLAFYNDSFSSSLGIVTQIRYYAGGGNGADGFSFFLVDGDEVDENNIEAGAAGGALGYMQNGSLTPGIPYAYLGVGFDEFGGNASANGNFSQPFSPDSVVLHGSGNGITGYDYLTHTSVADDLGQSIDGGWRLARITVLPAVGGSVVRVEMSWDEGVTWLTVIDDYEYNESMPTNLKLGFAASTGAATNIHAIGDLSVTVPADLELNMITSPSGTYGRGDNIVYSYQVNNTGPNGAGTSTITNSLPIGDSGFSNISWTAVTSTGTTTTGDATNVSSIPVNLPNGVSVTITVNAKIGKNVISTDDLDISIETTPGAGVSDPSPSTGQLTVNLTIDVPTPATDTALDVIESFGSTRGGSVKPNVDDYTNASTTGVTSENLLVINAAIAAYGSGAGLTSEVLQSIIDGVIYDLANPRPVVRVSAGSGITYGCTDINASNYNQFSASMPSLCVYDSTRSNFTTGTTSKLVELATVRDLKLGMTGNDVMLLQKVLNKNGYPVTSVGVGSTGNETTKFGSLTKSALIKFQKENNIKPVIGYFGPVTRAKMKNMNLLGLWW